MKRLIIFLLLFAAIKVAGQTTGYLRFDTVRIMKQNGTCELYIINATKDSLGLLTNVGGGLTQFRKSRVLNDSTIVVGLDTLTIIGGAGSGGSVSISQGYGITNTPNPITTTGTIDVDSATLSSYYLRRKDSTDYATQYDLTQIVSGINQLTGDVTAGPGTGSQAATIAANAVTDAKLRQGAATSVIGRASNSTGNVADIQATIASTYLKRTSTALTFDSVDYAEVKNLPPVFPGAYIAPAQSFNPGFLVVAFGIARPTTAWFNGVTIPWELITSGDHQPSFFDSVYGSASTSRLVVRFPNVKNVLTVNINPDEQFANNVVTVGPTVALDNFEALVTRGHQLGITLRGAGTDTWTKVSSTGLSNYFDVTTYSTADGGTSFNLQNAAYGFDYNGLNVQYIGPGNYHIKRQYSGIGSYNVRFLLRDAADNPVSVNPTSVDEIVISSAGFYPQTINMRTFNTSNTFLTTSCNFWIIGLFEAWIVAAPVSSSSIQVRYQTVYPSATNYKVYRSTSLYGTETLVHTGTTGIFTDAGLTANTVYYYKLYATIGTDTYITYFRTNTYF